MDPVAIDQLVHQLIPEAQMQPQSVADVLALPSFASVLTRCEQQVGSPFAQLAAPLQLAINFRRAQQLVQILRVNPLWQQRLDQAGCLSYPQTLEQWQALPIMERDDLHELYMGHRPGLVVPLDHGHFQIIASGGTSGGQPIETVYSLSELRDTYALAGQFFDRHILPQYLQQTPRWMATTLNDYEMWSSGSMLGGVLQNIPSCNFIHAGPMSPRTYAHMMAFAGPKAILGMSREIEGLIELGQDLPLAQRQNFKVAFYGSGIIQPRKVSQLQQLYPDLQILSYFASNQAEAIGIQCQPNTPLVAVPGLHFIEIVDDQGRWVAEGEEGELVITRLHAQAAPILRMKLGDRMIRRPSVVGADLVGQCFEFAGRSSDIIHLGESHYSGPRTLAQIGSGLLVECGWDLETNALALQFCNDRQNKRLVLRVVVEDPELLNQALKMDVTQAKSQVRAIFVKALGQSLSLFDQTDQQLQALEATVYQFGIELMTPSTSTLYRTGVNKIPLIRDLF